MPPVDRNEESASGVETLVKRVSELERQVADLEAGFAIQASGDERALLRALTEVKTRLEEVERENRDFARMYVEIQHQNEALTNLYVASQRLHTTLELDQVKQIIAEILVEMVGAEEFGLLVLDGKKQQLQLLAGEGIDRRLPKHVFSSGEGVIGDVAATGESFFFEPRSDGAREAHLPLATLPLKLNGQTVGVMVIYKLLSHKTSFSPIDHRILELVAADAASALVSARLHGRMDRKLKTIEGFMKLMKS
ncbi:MAG TPA: GAF domain-containing protein [Vicinamibacteria bacterium]|nr:GAF domain-containing protein [Vicinamibacteria bacterium]